jgi:tetratricopeptide (TPR) repeat protein
MIHNALGGLYVLSKQPDKAEAEFKKAIELNNTIPTSYMNLAQLYLASGKLEQAMQEYEAIVVKNPKVLQAHLLLGMIYQQKNQYDKAKAQYEQVLALNPKFAPAANNLAWLMMEHGDNIDVALAYAQTAREQSAEDPHIADTLGWIYYKKNAYLKAVSLLKEAAEKLPSDPVVQYHYGMAQDKNGNPEAAKKTLAASLKLNPNYPGADEARKVLSQQ